MHYVTTSLEYTPEGELQRIWDAWAHASCLLDTPTSPAIVMTVYFSIGYCLIVLFGIGVFHCCITFIVYMCIAHRVYRKPWQRRPS